MKSNEKKSLVNDAYGSVRAFDDVNVGAHKVFFEMEGNSIRYSTLNV